MHNKNTVYAGKLIISLDFELLWGVFDVVDWEVNRNYFTQTKNVIPEILKLFLKQEIHATWATVGMLFNKSWEEWEKNIPPVLPNYENQNLSAYSFGKSIKSSLTEEFCFAPKLIQQVFEASGQEVATHTYSHYYCLEKGQTAESFESDIEKAMAVASAFDIEVQSLVFPRNQFAAQYLKICNKHGIKNVRTNPKTWYWRDTTSNTALNKLGRTGDAYLNLGTKSYPKNQLIRSDGQPLKQKASRFFRPVEENGILRRLKLRRILSEMDWAAKNSEIYHLWWHPHNFGSKPEESMKDLEIILKYFARLRNKYNFQSLNMRELGDSSN